MAKANPFLKSQLADLREKEAAMSSRSNDLQTTLDAHNAEWKDVKAAIKALEPLVPVEAATADTTASTTTTTK